MKNQNFTDDNFFDEIEKGGQKIDPEQREKIRKRVNEILSYQPKVGILGKAGVGKSSLCNALFGKEDFAKISHTKAQTREIQEALLKLSDDKGLIIVDVPGLGENIERQAEYTELYKNLLPELDIILWLLKADERAYSIDHEFYNTHIKPHLKQGKPLLFVMSQVDKIHYHKDWDLVNKKPGESQEKNIALKKEDIASGFKVSEKKIIAVSAEEKYNLIALVESIISALPNDKKITVLKGVEEENISEKAKNEATKSFFEVAFGETLGGIAEKVFGEKAREVGTRIGEYIGRGVNRVVDFFKGIFG